MNKVDNFNFSSPVNNIIERQLTLSLWKNKLCRTLCVWNGKAGIKLGSSLALFLKWQDPDTDLRTVLLGDTTVGQWCGPTAFPPTGKWTLWGINGLAQDSKSTLISSHLNGVCKSIRKQEFRKWSKTQKKPLAVAAQWTEYRPANQKVTSSIPVRAHAWVVGQVPNWGHARCKCSMFLSLSFSFPPFCPKPNK